MHQRVNRQVRLKSRPSGIPQAEHFEIVEAPVPDPSDGEVLVRNIYLSVDPAMRGWVSAVANYSEPVAVGAVMRSGAVGRVEESRSADFHAGDCVLGMFGWQRLRCRRRRGDEAQGRRLGLPISTSLRVLVLNRLNGLLRLARGRSAQRGRDYGRVHGSGGGGSCVGRSKVKVASSALPAGPTRWLFRRLRYDSAVDYKADDLEAALDAACPEGADVSFDNTAGLISDSIMGRLNVGARVVICGTASIASWDPPPPDRGSSVIFSSNAHECRAF